MDPLNELGNRLAQESASLTEQVQRLVDEQTGTLPDSTRAAWLRGKRDGIGTAIGFLDALNPPPKPPGFKLPAWWLTDPIEEPTPPSDLSTVMRVRVERHTSGVNTYLDEGWRLLQVNLNEVAGASAFLLGLDRENAE